MRQIITSDLLTFRSLRFARKLTHPENLHTRNLLHKGGVTGVHVPRAGEVETETCTTWATVDDAGEQERICMAKVIGDAGKTK